jgi:hypothetical protein
LDAAHTEHRRLRAKTEATLANTAALRAQYTVERMSEPLKFTCADMEGCQCRAEEITQLYDDLAVAKSECAGLRTAMESRAVIEQAKGIIMLQRRCTAEQAFDSLVLTSQRTNRKLRDIAEQIVAGCSSRSVPRITPKSDVA